MGHRYYAYGNGHFLTRDPIGYAGGINLYGFVGNNPITGIDPNGTQDPNSGLGEFAQGLEIFTSDPEWKTGSPQRRKVAPLMNFILGAPSSAYTAATGKDAISGTKVSRGVRALAVVGIVTALVGIHLNASEASAAKKAADPNEYASYERAWNAALEWLSERGFRAEKPVIGKAIGASPNVGKAIGMSTADGRVGFRIEWTPKYGAHINVFDHNAPKLGILRNLPHFKFPGGQDLVNSIIKRFEGR